MHSAQIIRKLVSGGQELEYSETILAGERISVEQTIPIGEENYEIDVMILVAKVRWAFIVLDQNNEVKTNNAQNPDQTVTFWANIPYEYSCQGYVAFLFTTNITKLFITNTTGNELTLRMDLGVDPTP
jgi:hypothetical protein